MAKQSFTIKRARAHSKAAPKDAAHGTKAGYGGPTRYGKGGVAKGMFKPGGRTRATGPESGRNYRKGE